VGRGAASTGPGRRPNRPVARRPGTVRRAIAPPGADSPGSEVPPAQLLQHMDDEGLVDTSAATSASFTPTSTGCWCFAAYYSGDGNSRRAASRRRRREGVQSEWWRSWARDLDTTPRTDPNWPNWFVLGVGHALNYAEVGWWMQCLMN
jgi:hypothetical protein